MKNVTSADKGSYQTGMHHFLLSSVQNVAIQGIPWDGLSQSHQQ